MNNRTCRISSSLSILFPLFLFVLLLIPAFSCSQDQPDTGLQEEDVSSMEPMEGSRTLRDAMIDVNRELYNLIDDVETVEDADRVDGEIGRVFADLFEGIQSGKIYDPTPEQNMSTTMMSDPEVLKWSNKLDGRLEELKSSHPEAGEKLEQSFTRYGMKMMASVQELLRQATTQMEQKYGTGDADGSDATPVELSEAEKSQPLNVVMTAMMRDMYSLIENVQTVEDVEKIDGDIGRLLDRMIGTLRYRMREDPVEVQQMNASVQNDPELLKWKETISKKMTALKREHPAASAKLEDVMGKHTMRMMKVLQEMMTDAMKQMESE